MTETKAIYKAGETETIQPCPFCGEDNNLAVGWYAGGPAYVSCICGATGPRSKLVADAVLLWNAAANEKRIRG